jgi:hypothetical protein
MALNQPLSDELEAKAQELAGRIRERADDDILELARLLVSKDDPEIFGDIVHRIGAQAFEERLKKRMATKDRASSARGADKAPSSKDTVQKGR